MDFYDLKSRLEQGAKLHHDNFVTLTPEQCELVVDTVDGLSMEIAKLQQKLKGLQERTTAGFAKRFFGVILPKNWV